MSHDEKSIALEIGHELVDLCRQGKAMDAIDKFYSPSIVSIEAVANPMLPQRLEGLADVRGKTEWWEANYEVHGRHVDGPYPHGDRFIVRFKYDVTPKQGPMAGQRMDMDETALYTIADGKIVQEEFFYSMGG